MCHVYVIEAVGENLVKVGIADDVATRISSLQCGCPFKLKKYNHVGGLNRETALLIEKKCHSELDRFRSHGEWFRIPPNEAYARLIRIVMEHFNEVPRQPRMDIDDLVRALA